MDFKIIWHNCFPWGEEVPFETFVEEGWRSRLHLKVKWWNSHKLSLYRLGIEDGSALKTWTSSWKREGSADMNTLNAPTVQSRQPLTYRLLESVGLGGPRWLGSSWQRGIAESGSSQLSTLMIETPGDAVWDLPCMQQASYLEGGPLLWILPLLHVNQKSDDDDDDVQAITCTFMHGLINNLAQLLSLRSRSAIWKICSFMLKVKDEQVHWSEKG